MTDWELGLQAFREGRTREAVDRLQAASAETQMTVSQSVRFDTLAYLGAALYALGRPSDAVGAFEGARKVKPGRTAPAELLMNLTHAYLASGRRPEARQTLISLLGDYPGHVAGRMLLNRLNNTPATQPITGAVLGDSVESVRRYLHTLTFETVSAGGYSPAQVREALSQMERYIDSTNQQMSRSEETIRQQKEEIVRLRQTEEALIQNMVNAQQNTNGVASDPAPGSESLTPIEALFQQKP